ncbi:toprim domain-containing protein [Bartonella massiliensis]|uniref:toprim domain-containing protein n=1 Tax=Bartonella massiliensis TaxID=929795 RepID=UPI00115B6B7E|nr:toprim domain-containing protein [Bartonella massiliensis]
MSTIFEIKQKLIAQTERIAEMLLPQGHKRGNHWIIGNTRGEPGQSLSICLSGSKAGLWYDFAEGIGGDLLDLWCAVKGMSLSQALEEARATLNLTRPKPFMAPQRSYRRPPVSKWRSPQTLVKNYLHKERHIPLEVIKRYRIGEEGEKIIFPFYKPDGTLALVKERLAQAGAKTKPTAAQCEPILFGWQALYPTTPASQHASQPTTADHTAPRAFQCAPTNHTTTQASQPAAANHAADHITTRARQCAPAAHTAPQTSADHTTTHASEHTSTTHTTTQASQPAAADHAADHIATRARQCAPTNHTAPQTSADHTTTPASEHTSTTHTTTQASQPAAADRTTQSAPANHAADHIATRAPQCAPTNHTAPQTSADHTTTQASQPAAADHTAQSAAAPQCAPADRTTQPADRTTQCAPADHVTFPRLSSKNRTIVITEGEIDALSLAAYGYPAVSLPFGGGRGGKHNWIENEFDHLEAFETIFLATDMDQPGEEAAREIASRLGRHRCYRVRLPLKDANDCLTAKIDAATIAAAFASAQCFAPEGLRRASDYKDQVIGLFWPEPEKHVGYTVPYPKLKGKLHFRPAELTLWSGASGAGKSQLLSDCIPHWIAQNSRLCLASLEMKGEQSLRRLTKQTGGLEKPTKETIERILHFLDEGLILYEHVGKSNVETLLDVFDYCRARYGCDQFIIDSLMRLGIASDDYAAQEQAVYKMVDWAVLNNVHIHLVAHARKGGLDKDIPGTEDIKGASEIGANAFNIITIWRNRSLEDKIFAASLTREKADLIKRPGVIMNIAKQRSGDFEGKVGLWFDPQTYRYRCSFEQSLPRHYL